MRYFRNHVMAKTSCGDGGLPHLQGTPGLPSNSAVWTWEGGWLPHKYVTRRSSLTLCEPISQGFYSSQPSPRYSRLSLRPPYICAISQRHWDPCIFLAQNCIAESSYNLENTKAFQVAGEKSKRQANHNHNKKQSIRLYKLVYIQFTMWFYQLFVQFKQQNKWTSQYTCYEGRST